MKKVLGMLVLLFFVSGSYAANDMMRAIRGTVSRIDSAAKTLTLKASDGRQETLHIGDQAIVKATDASGKLVDQSWDALKQGTEVVAHYTTEGTKNVAAEIYKVGRGGLKKAEGTLKLVDTGGKKLVVETGRGMEETFSLTEHAAKSETLGAVQAVQKGAKVTVYYAEEAGQKTAHFFEHK